MSSRTKHTSPLLIGAVLGISIAVAVAVSVGLGIWPPQTAFAAPQPAGSFLGVNDGTQVAIGPRVDTLAKFSAASAVTSTLAPKALTKPALKKAAPVPVAKPAPKPVVKKVVKKKAAAKKPKKRVASATSTSGWKTARCSTYGIGDGLIGEGMAGGGVLRADSMVVAHRSLPFGTRIQFSYKGRTCTAVVQDRGPFIASRIFDLGPGTAKALGFDGVGNVKYKILGR